MRPFAGVCLADPPDFVAVRRSLADFPVLSSLQVVQFGNCQDLSKFFTRMRNAIAHKHLKFSCDSRDLAAVIITMSDGKWDQKTKTRTFDWEITINGADLGILSRYVAHRVIAARL